MNSYTPIAAMNAVDISKKPDKLRALIATSDYNMEEKIQGNRMDIYFHTDGNLLITRGKFHKQLWLPDLATPIPELHNVQLTGEIYHPKYNDNQLAGLLNRKEYPIAPDIMRDIRLYVFDVVRYEEYDVCGLPWEDRFAMLLNMKENLEAANYKIRVIPSYTKLTPTFVAETFDKIVAAGGEGIMLKHKRSLYQPGKRPANTWYKVKKTMTSDLIVIGFTPGKGKYEGMIGALMCGAYKADQIIHICNVSGFTDQVRRDISNNPAWWRGKVVEVKGFVSTTNSIRECVYVRMREDKQPKECILED